MEDKEIKLSITYADELGETTTLEKVYNEDVEEDFGTIWWMLNEFKYFMRAYGYAEESINHIVYLEKDEKVVDENGEVIYERK